MERRIAALFLILAVIFTGLTGCSKKVGDNTATKAENTKKNKMGRYIEETVELPKMAAKEHIVTILQNQEKNLVAYTVVNSGAKAYNSYTRKDDKNWVQDTPKWLNDGKISKKTITLQTLCIGEDGSYYALCYDCSGNLQKSLILKAKAENEASLLVNIPYLNKKVSINNKELFPYVSRIQVLKNGSFVLYDGFNHNHLLVFSGSGKQLDNITIGQEQKYMAVGNEVITINETNTGIIRYDTVNQKIADNMDYKIQESEMKGNENITYARKADGTLFIADSNGIHRLEKGGTLWETMVDGALNTMSMPTVNIDKLFVSDGERESYYVSYLTGEDETKLMHYVYHKDIPSVPQNEITVYSLYENNTVRQAIALFQSKNPDCKVNYVVQMNTEDNNTEDYIRALNTELFAGKGADVLVLDGLPVASYIDKGVLKDISDIVNPMEKKEKILTNISRAYHTNGKVYRIPVRFSVPIMIGSSAALHASDSMEHIAGYIRNARKPYSPSRTYSMVMNDYLSLFSNTFIRENKVDGAALRSFLENTKVVTDNIKATKYLRGENKEKEKLDTYLRKETLFSSDDTALVSGKYETATESIRGVYDSMILYAILGKTKLNYSTINNCFIPQGEIGLNAASKNKIISKKFIRSLFMEELQNTNTYDGFPVVKNSFYKWESDEALEPLKNSMIGTGNISGGFPGMEKVKEFMNTVVHADSPIDYNLSQNRMIMEESLSYLEGKVNIDQAVNAITQKLSLYLAE